MKFADIPDREDVKRRLTDMADNNRLPHALLLEGPSGTGKFMLARALAQYIHCENPINGDSCGVCPSCRQHMTYNHIDTIFSFPVIKKNSRPTVSGDLIAEFRQMLDENPFMDPDSWSSILESGNTQPKIYVEEGAELIRRLNFRAHQSRYKIVLIWLAERLGEDTANKLLKLIEEPHDDTLFILTSDSPRLVLPTIYSRTQRIAVGRYDDQVIADYLVSSGAVDRTVATDIARLAEGNMNRALALINVSQMRTRFLELFIELMRKAYLRQIGMLRSWSNDVAALGRESQLSFLDYCAHMIRENFILNLHDPALNYLSSDEKSFSVKFAPYINSRNVIRIFNSINDARRDIAGNANAKIVFFDLAIKTILLLKQ